MNDFLIDDFFDISREIHLDYINSRFPKFIAKMIANHQKKKVFKSIDNFKNSKIILNKNNLMDFANHIISSFPPYGEYKNIISIILSVHQNKDESIAATLFFDKYRIIIHLSTVSETFDIEIEELVIEDDSRNMFKLSLSKLYSPNVKANTRLIDINNRIKTLMCDYIAESINQTFIDINH